MINMKQQNFKLKKKTLFVFKSGKKVYSSMPTDPTTVFTTLTTGTSRAIQVK